MKWEELVDFDKIKAALCAHQAVTGNKPLAISMPAPEITAFGVKIHFYNMPTVVTSDAKNAVHHQWRTNET